MQEALSFVPTRVGEISRSLGSMFDAPDTSGYVARASGGNFFIVGVSSGELAKASYFAADLSAVHKARFFVVAIDEDTSEIAAEAASVAQSGPQDDPKDALEVVRLRSPSHLSSAVTSILRANSIPGFASVLYVWDWLSDPETVRYMMGHVDSVMFDSGAMRRSWDFFDTCCHANCDCVDLNWIRLGAWREQVRGAFERNSVQSMIPFLKHIEVACTGGDRDDATPFLLAGWIIDRLDLEPVAYSPHGFECIGKSGLSVIIGITVEEVPGPFKIREIFFGTDGDRNSIRVKKEAKFLTQVNGDEELSFSQEVQSDDYFSLLERYFLLGETTRNFSGALAAGRELFQLRQGFLR